MLLSLEQHIAPLVEEGARETGEVVVVGAVLMIKSMLGTHTPDPVEITPVPRDDLGSFPVTPRHCTVPRATASFAELTATALRPISIQARDSS
jgi:hypothetical protein